jgi:hypothetical protein
MMMLAFAALAALSALLLTQQGLLGRAASGFLLMLTGALVSAVFSYASLRGIKDQRAVVSPLYAADLLGGCLGSVLGSLLLAPALGLGASSAGLALLALSALLLV